MKSERVETESNEAQAMELQAQVLQAEKAIARQIWRKNALKSKLAEAENRKWKADIEGGGGGDMRFLG